MLRVPGYVTLDPRMWSTPADIYVIQFCFIMSLVTDVAMLASFASIRGQFLDAVYISSCSSIQCLVLILLRAWALWIHRRCVLAVLLVAYILYAVGSLAVLLYAAVIVPSGEFVLIT